MTKAVTDLIAKTPCAGLLPVDIGGLALRELTPARITSIMPLNGQDSAVSEALELTLPAVGKSRANKKARVIWVGQGQYFLLDAKPPKLPAGLTDQSDAWAMVTLEGKTAPQVLARLCPADCAAMKKGDVIRSQIGHMMAVIIRSANGYEIMVFRAFAGTLVHEMSQIMTSLAAQAGIAD